MEFLTAPFARPQSSVSAATALDHAGTLPVPLNLLLSPDSLTAASCSSEQPSNLEAATAFVPVMLS